MREGRPNHGTSTVPILGIDIYFDIPDVVLGVGEAMRRREFITLVGGAAGAAWPLAVRAQQIGRPRRIGILGADATVWRPWTAAFTSRLRELGWIEGETVAIDYRWGEYVWVPGGRRRSSERVSEAAAELLRQNVDVILNDPH
jgi:putative tryptophan/tyrosine transport system substrate-binding protein